MAGLHLEIDVTAIDFRVVVRERLLGELHAHNGDESSPRLNAPTNQLSRHLNQTRTYDVKHYLVVGEPTGSA